MRGCACRGTAGFAHVSCLAEQAKILFAEALENNLGGKVLSERMGRWDTCSLCEQKYHGVVACALGWACWKTYVGRPEGDWVRVAAMTAVGNGLHDADMYEDALSVKEAELSMRRRHGDSVENILVVQANLANTYNALGRLELALSMRRDVYSGHVRLFGESHEHTLGAVLNYANSLVSLERFGEAKALLRKTIPAARRVPGESDEDTLRLRCIYARALYDDPAAPLDDLREAMNTFEDADRIARRVFGGSHPLVEQIQDDLRNVRYVLRACEAREK